MTPLGQEARQSLIERNEKIRKLYREGLDYDSLRLRFGVSKPTLSVIISRGKKKKRR